MGRKPWQWQWIGGGLNIVSARDREEALALAVVAGLRVLGGRPVDLFPDVATLSEVNEKSLSIQCKVSLIQGILYS